jgi:hypothetical protein
MYRLIRWLIRKWRSRAATDKRPGLRSDPSWLRHRRLRRAGPGATFLVVLNAFSWRITSAAFKRERVIAGIR